MQPGAAGDAATAGWQRIPTPYAALDIGECGCSGPPRTAEPELAYARDADAPVLAAAMFHVPGRRDPGCPGGRGGRFPWTRSRGARACSGKAAATGARAPEASRRPSIRPIAAHKNAPLPLPRAVPSPRHRQFVRRGQVRRSRRQSAAHSTGRWWAGQVWCFVWLAEFASLPQILNAHKHFRLHSDCKRTRGCRSTSRASAHAGAWVATLGQDGVGRRAACQPSARERERDTHTHTRRDRGEKRRGGGPSLGGLCVDVCGHSAGSSRPASWMRAAKASFRSACCCSCLTARKYARWESARASRSTALASRRARRLSSCTVCF